MTHKKIVFFFLLPVIISLALHFHVFNLDLIGYHVWRQTQTQTVIYNFSFSDNNILHPQRFDLGTGSTALLYEFPLYQWLIAQFNNLTGYSVAHTRAITFGIFVFFLLGFYKLLRRFVSVEVSLLTNALVCFSPLLYYYGVNPLPDVMALCLATWALYFFFVFLSSGPTIHFVIFAFFLMLAALVKLPYILFAGVAVPYVVQKIKQREFKMVLAGAAIFGTFMIPVLVWYAAAIPTWKNNLITHGMLQNQKTASQLLGYFWFSLISSVPELLTNYASCLLLVTGIILFFKRKKYLNNTAKYFVAVFVLFSLYFLFELNMIEKTHDYYLMPFVPLIFMVVALGVNFFYRSKYRMVPIFIACIVPLTAWLRIDTRWNEQGPGFVADYIYDQKIIQSLLPENALCIIDYDDSRFISLYYLKRKGYSLLRNEITPGILKDNFLKGATYLVTEEPAFDPGVYKDFNFVELYHKDLRIYQFNLK